MDFDEQSAAIEFDEPQLPAGAAAASGFDERPATAAGSGAAAFAEDALQDTVEDFSSLSLESKFAHSNWKARREALEHIAVFAASSGAGSAANSSEKSIFLASLPRLSKESNPAVLEQLFETSVLLLEHEVIAEGEELKEMGSHVLKLAVEKGIVGRPKSVQSCGSLLSLLTANAFHEHVTNALIAGFSHKTPKNRQAALLACANIIKEFGPQHLPAKSILKAVSPLFNDANAAVRKEAQNLYCQFYCYLGAGIKAFLGDLREVQVNEMMKTFEELQVGQVPEKSIKGFASAKPKAVAAVSANANMDADAEMTDEIYNMMDEVAVIGKLPKNFFTVVGDKTQKWQDRCAMARDNLLPLITPPKRLRVHDEYHELFKTVRELFLDPQAPLMLIAIQSLQYLCKGLRQFAAPHVRPFIAPLFDKMKDKKTSVLEHVNQTLLIMLKNRCVTLDHLHDEMELVMTTTKVPNQRGALLQFVSVALDSLEASQFNRLSRATALFQRLVNDEKLENREAAVVLISKMTRVLGENVVQPILVNLEAKHMKKILLGSDSATSLDASLFGAQQSSATAMTGESPSGQSPMKKAARVETAGPAGALVKSLSASALAAPRKAVGAATSARVVPLSLSKSAVVSPALSSSMSEGKRTAANTPQAAGHSDEQLEGLLPREEAIAKLETVFSGEVEGFLQQFGVKEWKLRSEAVQRLGTIVETMWSEEQCTTLLESIVAFLRGEPVWKDSIFQVTNAVISALTLCVRRATSLSTRCGFCIIQNFTPRLTEPKCKGPTRELLSTIAEGVTPKVVFKHTIQLSQSVKNPKLTQEVNEWLCIALAEFRGTPVDVKVLVDYVKGYCFEQTQPPVKTSAVLILAALHQRMGAKLEPLLLDLNPHIKASVDAEIEKRGASSAAAAEAEVPCRLLKAALSAACTGSSAPTAGKAGKSLASSSAVAEADETYDAPRVDVSQLFAAAVRDMINGKEWKIRSVAIKKVEEIVTSVHGRILPNGITDVLKALRTRFEESNKNMVVDALRSISVVIDAAEPAACRPGLKAILPSVFALLGDQKANLRDEAVKVSHAGVRIIGMDAALPLMQRPMTSEGLAPRQISVDILDKALEALQQEPEASRQGAAVMDRTLWLPMVPTLLKLAMDRTVEIRSAVDRILGVIVPIVGVDTFAKQLLSLKPAEQQQVRPMLEKRFAAVASLQQQVVPPLSSAAPPPTARSQQLQYQNGAVVSTAAAATHPSISTTSRGMVSTSPAVAVLSLQNSAVASSSGVATSPIPMVSSLQQPQAHQHPFHQLQAPPQNTVPRLPLPVTSSASNAYSVQPLAAAAAPQSRQAPIEPDVLMTPQDIVNGMQTAPTSLAHRMCMDFMRRFRKGEDCGTVDMMHVMMDRLLVNTTRFDSDLSIALINCLCVMFDSPRAALRCDAASLVGLFRSVFDCLLSEQFAQSDTIIRSVNNMALKMLGGGRADNVFSALMSLLSEYSSRYLQSNSKLDQKLIQLSVKCLIRHDTELSPAAVITSCHDYLLQHPPSSFRDRDDLSIRTIKTLLQRATAKHGRELKDMAENLVGKENLVTHFIGACLDNRDRALRRASEAQQPPSTAAGTSPADSTTIDDVAPPSSRLAQVAIPTDVSNVNGRGQTAAAAAVPSPLQSNSSYAASYHDPVNPNASSTPTYQLPQQLPFKRIQPTSTATFRAETLNISASSADDVQVRIPSFTSSGPSLSSGNIYTPTPTPSPTVSSSNFTPTAMFARVGESALNQTATQGQAIPIAPSSSCDSPVSAMIAKIRNHTTSTAGVQELYAYLKSNPNCSDFSESFTKLSQAFQSYIKRRLERAVYDDPTGSAFQLPLVVQQTS